MTDIKQTLIQMSKMNNFEQSRLSWIFFQNNVSSEGRCVDVCFVLIIWFRQFILKGCHKISVLMQWAIEYKQMERYVHCVYVPGFKGYTYIHCRHRHLPKRYALLLRCNNFSHPDMHITLSRQYVPCCNHMYVLFCNGLHYCKNISQVSVNHLEHGVLLGTVAGKKSFRYVFQRQSTCCRTIPNGFGYSRLTAECERGQHFH